MQERFCEKAWRLPLSTVNGATEHGRGRGCRKGRCFFRIAKFWYRSLHMKQEELLKCCYVWWIGNLRRKN